MIASKAHAAFRLRPAIAALSIVAVPIILASCSGDDAQAPPWMHAADANGGDAGAESAVDAGDHVDAKIKDGAADTGKDGASAGDSSPAGLDAESGADAGDGSSGMTSCVWVAHIGDSLTAYTEPSLTAAYALVGATAQINAYGGRAIKQKLDADPMTGKQAAASIRADGFTGCWVVALGTNDTADVAAGAWYTRGEAIDEMMAAIDETGTAPVMWVNTYTTRTSGSWSNDNMVLWNQALTAALPKWPNMKIHDWASVADDGNAPFVDGIHHTAAGYEVRNASIAHALASFYPAP